MILLTLNNGIPVSWRTYRTELGLAREIKRQANVVLTPGHLSAAVKKSVYKISKDMWILSDGHDDQDKDLEERYLHEES